MKVDKCLGCGAVESDYFGSSNSFVEVIKEKKFTQDAYRILKCRSCGLYYKDNILSEASFNEYYNSFDFDAWTPQSKFITEEIVSSYLSNKSNLRILDYGCSTGRFLSGFIGQHQCYGYDIDLRALKIAETKGIIPMKSNELVADKNKFDVVILSDVFEHSLEPTKLIERLLSMLNEKGVLIISTGYADAPAAQYDLANFWYFKTIQHVCMIGMDYINFIQSRFKAAVIKKELCSHYNGAFKKKLFFRIRFDLFRFIDSNRNSAVTRLIAAIPYLNKISKWTQQPYYPYSKDHIVLFLQNEKA